MSSHRRSLRVFLLVVLFAAGCAYGMLAERHTLFPHSQVRAVLTVLRGGASSDSAALPETGRWTLRRPCGPDGTALTADELTEEQRAEMERLESIGYLTGSTPAGECEGVTVHDEAAAHRGVNLVVSGHRPWAGLMDMNGVVLHEWTRDFAETWPDRDVPEDSTGDRYWRRAHVLPDGGLLAIHEGLGLVRLDRDSRVIWALEGGYHHDLELDGDGNIWILDRQAGVVERVNARDPILEDFVTVLTPGGDVIARFSLLEAFESSPYSFMLKWMDRKGDIFHTNTLEILDGRLADRSPAFAEGNLLISVLMLDTIAIVDPSTEVVVWALAGMWRQQHQPTVLESGKMLLFDNEAGRQISKVIEMDPFTQRVTWSYRGSAERPFYTSTCGSNQRLPNGNTLITESDNGRAFEVTPERDIVWEYVNPHRAGPDGEFIATLFEVVRLPEDFELGTAE